ncbi:MAG TPA: CAP domain-containing protein [Gemmatimonadales bacterium]|nr:CAP domain-containing protein [Gemmatimonadales bacterium]
MLPLPTLSTALLIVAGTLGCGRAAVPAPSPRPEAPAAGAGASRASSLEPRDAASATSDDARLATAVLAEVNRVRTDPAGYAKLLEAMLPQFDGRLFRRPDQPSDLVTQEGAAAIEEAIRVLRRTAPLPPLAPAKGLTRAAAEHVRDQGKAGTTGHVGFDGSSPATRAARHGEWLDRLTENIMYGATTAREVVVGLVVDDGVPGRGHRRNILDPEVRVAGAACGPHRTFHEMCVVMHAGGFR